MRWLAAVGLALLTAGCGATWHHPQMAGNEAGESQRRAIDQGYCRRVVAGVAPMPSIPMPQQAPLAYSFSGQGTSFGPGGVTASTYRGTAVPYASPAQSFAGGAANGMAMGAAMAAMRERNEIFDGCMMELGWRAGRRQASAAASAAPQAIRSASLSGQADTQSMYRTRSGDWMILHDGDENVIAMNRDAVNVSPSRKRAWVLHNFRNPRGESRQYLSVLALHEFDCQQREFTNVEATGYSDRGGGGEQVFQTTATLAPVRGQPGSLGATMIDRVCGAPGGRR